MVGRKDQTTANFRCNRDLFLPTTAEIVFTVLFYSDCCFILSDPSASVSLVLFYSDYYSILSILLLFVLFPILPFVVTALAASETLAPEGGDACARGGRKLFILFHFLLS